MKPGEGGGEPTMPTPSPLPREPRARTGVTSLYPQSRQR